MIFCFQTVKLDPSNLQVLSNSEKTLLDAVARGRYQRWSRSISRRKSCCFPVDDDGLVSSQQLAIAAHAQLAVALMMKTHVLVLLNSLITAPTRQQHPVWGS